MATQIAKKEIDLKSSMCVQMYGIDVSCVRVALIFFFIRIDGVCDTSANV